MQKPRPVYLSCLIKAVITVHNCSGVTAHVTGTADVTLVHDDHRPPRGHH